MAYTLDSLCRFNLEEEPARAVPWFLCTSILYYRPELVGEEAPLSVISDECFDWMSHFILEHWDACQAHQHSSFLCKEDVKCGSGYALPYEKLPSRILGGAEGMAATWREQAQGTRARPKRSFRNVKTAARRTRQSGKIKPAAP